MNSMKRFLATAAAFVGLSAAAGLANADTITATIKNNTSSDYVVHVYDMFGGTTREVRGSPFALAAKETSKTFPVNAGDGPGKVMYECEGGPSKSDIEVANGNTVSID